jgi:hypothetical protein
MSPPATFRHATASQVCLQVQHRVRPKPAIHRLFEMLQRSPSLRPFVHRAAFCWVKRRSADGDLPRGSRTNACIHSHFFHTGVCSGRSQQDLIDLGLDWVVDHFKSMATIPEQSCQKGGSAQFFRYVAFAEKPSEHRQSGQAGRYRPAEAEFHLSRCRR